jgi:hypothetical protein
MLPLPKESNARDKESTMLQGLLHHRVGALCGLILLLATVSAPVAKKRFPRQLATGLTLNYYCNPGTVGTPWTCGPTVMGGTPPYTFTITYGPTNPPTWITIDPTTGILSGTPPYSFTFPPDAPMNLQLLLAKLNGGKK